MFKRIAKKAKKQKRDEKLGLDEEAKQVLGLQDTDSDESESDSVMNLGLGSDSDDSEDETDLDAGRDAGMKVEWLGEEGDDSEDNEGSDEEGLGLDDDFDDDPPVSLEEARETPIYLISTDPDMHECIVCPSKALKNAKMVEVHLQSAAHKRRFTKFRELAEQPKNRDRDPRRLVALLTKGTPKSSTKSSEGLSNRGFKRKLKLDKIRKRREVQKVMVAKKKRKREMKAAKPGDDETAKPSGEDENKQPKKRRKIEDDPKDNANESKPTKKGKAPSTEGHEKRVEKTTFPAKENRSQDGVFVTKSKPRKEALSDSRSKEAKLTKNTNGNHSIVKSGKSSPRKQKRKSKDDKELVIFD